MQTLSRKREKKKCRRGSAAFPYVQLLILALLICDTAAGLAGRLAGSLALAAATVLCALAQIAGLNGLDMLHDSNLHRNFLMKDYHKPRPKSTGQTG